MYLAYKYAKKRLNERNQPSAEDQPFQQLPQQTPPLAAVHDGSAPALSTDDTRALTASTPGDDYQYHSSAAGLPPAAAAVPEGPVHDSPEEKRRRRKYRLKIIIGLFAPFTLQALDTTIIASALKFIADDFRALCFFLVFSPFHPPLLTPPRKKKKKKKKKKYPESFPPHPPRPLL